jgi:aminoglycoside phosphotransferase (APT) family kinase protein
MELETAEELCRRYGLDLVAIHAQDTETSRLVACVRDQRGRQYVLKQTTPERGTNELAALRAWQPTGYVPRLVAELEPDLYLAEWLTGPSLAELPNNAPLDAQAIGHMIRGLHDIPPPDDLPTVSNPFAVRSQEDWAPLPPAMRAMAAGLTARLDEYKPPRLVRTHGDLVPTNVILTADGPKAIDPLGCRGLPSWDLAQLAAAGAGRGRAHLLPSFLAGYGEEPSLIAEMFAWMIFRFLRWNLDTGRTQFIVHLQPLAEELTNSGDLGSFMRQYCSRA